MHKNNNNNFISRSLKILPKFVGTTFLVYNGNSYKLIEVTKNMVGYKFGEFTCTRVKHVVKKKTKKKK